MGMDQMREQLTEVATNLQAGANVVGGLIQAGAGHEQAARRHEHALQNADQALQSQRQLQSALTQEALRHEQALQNTDQALQSHRQTQSALIQETQRHQQVLQNTDHALQAQQQQQQQLQQLATMHQDELARMRQDTTAVQAAVAGIGHELIEQYNALDGHSSRVAQVESDVQRAGAACQQIQGTAQQAQEMARAADERASSVERFVMSRPPSPSTDLHVPIADLRTVVDSLKAQMETRWRAHGTEHKEMMDELRRLSHTSEEMAASLSQQRLQQETLADEVKRLAQTYDNVALTVTMLQEEHQETQELLTQQVEQMHREMHEKYRDVQVELDRIGEILNDEDEHLAEGLRTHPAEVPGPGSLELSTLTSVHPTAVVPAQEDEAALHDLPKIETKEADAVKLNPVVEPPFFKNWRRETRQEFVSASRRGLAAFRYILAVEARGAKYEDCESVNVLGVN